MNDKKAHKNIADGLYSSGEEDADEQDINKIDGDEMDEEKELNGADDENDGNIERDETLVDVANMNVDMNEVNLRMQSIVEILADFKEKKEDSKSRQDYMDELRRLIMIYYDYNKDLTDLITNLFPPNEVIYRYN